MRAVVLRRTGSVRGLAVADVPKPVPAADEVLVRIHATTVTRGDVVVRKLPKLLARLSGMGAKRVLGHEFAAEIVAAGPDVRRFHVGERVFGTTTDLRQGSHAEYLCAPQAGILATLPVEVSFEDAAPVPVGGMAALFLLRAGGVDRGARVLVYGASGSVGTFAVQLAVHLGAHVTGVSSTRNLELVKSLGAAEVIDYTQEDVTRSDRTFDVIFDAVGKISPKRVRAVLSDGGSFVTVRSKTEEKVEHLLLLRDLLVSGEIRAVIDRRFTLEEVPEAHRYVETGRKRGNVLVLVAE